MKEWCLGFVFTDDCTRVMLLKKAKTMHVGLWNGIGGKLEANESAKDAMVRECKEEAKLDLPSWLCVGRLRGNNGGDQWCVHIFATEVSATKMDEVTSDWQTNALADTPYKFNTDDLSFMPLAPHTELLVAASRAKIMRLNTREIEILEV